MKVREAIGEACRRGGIGEVRKRAARMVINRQFIVRAILTAPGIVRVKWIII